MVGVAIPTTASMPFTFRHVTGPPSIGNIITVPVGSSPDGPLDASKTKSTSITLGGAFGIGISANANPVTESRVGVWANAVALKHHIARASPMATTRSLLIGDSFRWILADTRRLTTRLPPSQGSRLLRHRLLREPGRFEGLLAVDVFVDPRDLLAPKREYHRVGRAFQVDTSRISAARQTDERDYEIVPSIEDAIEFPTQVRKRLGPRRQPGANVVVPAVHGVLRVRLHRDPFDMRVQFRHLGIHAGLVVPFAEPPHQLNVLLRHRPPSISRWRGVERPSRFRKQRERPPSQPDGLSPDGLGTAPLRKQRNMRREIPMNYRQNKGAAPPTVSAEGRPEIEVSTAPALTETMRPDLPVKAGRGGSSHRNSPFEDRRVGDHTRTRNLSKGATDGPRQALRRNGR